MMRLLLVSQNNQDVVALRNPVSRGERNDHAATQRFTLRTLRILRVSREKSDHEKDDYYYSR